MYILDLWSFGMREDDIEDSLNIEDRRGDSGGFGGGFGGGGLPVRTGGGLGTIIVIILVLIFGGGKGLISSLLSAGGGSYSNQGYQSQSSADTQGLNDANNQGDTDTKAAHHIAKVLRSTELYWGKYFQNNGGRYNEPTLVLFRDETQSECGTASQASGPFYCPTDGKVYLDTGFFDEMRRSLGASGDFAEAYVVAHEIGHHVQDEFGILKKAHSAMARSGEDKGADSLAVRIELQADCFAGAWAKAAVADTGRLEQGDIEEAMQAANSVGDDRLQKRAQGYAVPDSFTHGTSAQRMKWFNVGMNTGDPEKCDTFSARDL